MREKSIKKKKFSVPHIYALLVSIIIVCTILTWVLPAGEFERQLNENGRLVVMPGTYHRVESMPVGFFQMITSIYRGMVDAADVIFFVFISYASIGLIIDSGAFNGLVAYLLRILRGKTRVIIIPIFITLIGALSSTVGVFEEMFPFIPIFVGIAIAMGYDAVVGLAIVALGCGLGYCGAFMNPFTVGMAQTIAGVPLLSGSWFRILDHIILIIIASIYTVRYALKIQSSPEKSLVYGDDFSNISMREDDLINQAFGFREKLVLLVLAVGVVIMVYGTSQYGWYLEELCALFLLMGLVSAIIMGWSPNGIAEKIAIHFQDIAVSCLVIGLARGILIVLQDGNIIDTVVYGLSIPLINIPKLLAGPAMLVVQGILSFFIPSGSGQAATSMPIMAPLADVLGIQRQVSVLAFNFADGITDIIWPTASAAIICGIAGVKIEKWWKFYVPLFVVLFILQLIMLVIAIAISFQ
ncbi:YfcC family protein [Paratissierella segnis]|uniref:YfcC family protein n=1 Tax=Paratissierella segnis TaxID=2763679 RepID=A0A926ILP9_9FIRM|nr:TIGR00366 family protein [Paratissierella segnis]MBC8588883.1 YfcC family protein [Paratissierella segnis]